MKENLIGLKVIILLNDFIEQDLYAEITEVAEADKELLLKLDNPLVFGDKTYEYAVAGPRLQGQELADLLSERILGCGVTWIPTTRFDSDKPFDLSWWRGGAADITTIILA